jgi:hypothetical protein
MGHKRRTSSGHTVMVPTTCNHAFSLLLPSINISSPRSRCSAQQSNTSVTNMPTHQQPTITTALTGRHIHTAHCQHTTTAGRRVNTRTDQRNTSDTVTTQLTTPYHLAGQRRTTSEGAIPTSRHHCPNSTSHGKGPHSHTSEGVCSPGSTSEGDTSAQWPSHIHQSNMGTHRHGRAATSAHIRTSHNQCRPTTEKNSRRKARTKINNHEICTEQNSPPKYHHTTHPQNAHTRHEASKQ